MATKGSIHILGEHPEGRPLRGSEIRVLLIDKDGQEHLIPAQSLVLRVGGRHEQAIATIEVPAVLVDIRGVELRTEAVVASGGPESQWEESLGKLPGDRIADVDKYAVTPHVVAGTTAPAFTEVNLDDLEDKPIGDPLAELDAVIARGGVIP